MDKKSVTVAVGASLVIIGSLVYFLMLSQGSSRDHAEYNQSTVESGESATYKEYSALKGVAYDKAFVSAMIEHHQGAIDMAELAATRARHHEVKNMATAIIATQGKEIAQLSAWQKQWGYPATPATASRDHEMIGGVMGGMGMIAAQLKVLSGDEFDRTFLMGMIDHHNQAVDMAKPAAKNAHHQEIKDAAASIINAQTSEINRMKQWQKDWRY